MYAAIINTPGYLPETEPAYFETAAEAWNFLREEVERLWDDYPDDDNGACIEAHTAIHAQDFDSPGTIYAPTPGGRLHDLGVAYSVEYVLDEDVPEFE